MLRIGYFGSYARGDWGVGSDVDLVIVVDSSASHRESTLDWHTTHLPIPADVLIYTAAEWGALMDSDLRFARVLKEETVWVHERA